MGKTQPKAARFSVPSVASDFKLPSNPGCQIQLKQTKVEDLCTLVRLDLKTALVTKSCISWHLPLQLSFPSSSFCLCFRKLIIAPKLSDICSSHGGFCLPGSETPGKDQVVSCFGS